MLYMDFVLRVALSMVLGFLIGLERQLTGHPAGIRINVLICMGTSFFTLFPMLYGSDQVFRVGSSIISGVGFLCSGVIFKDSGCPGHRRAGGLCECGGKQGSAVCRLCSPRRACHRGHGPQGRKHRGRRSLQRPGLLCHRDAGPCGERVEIGRNR